MAEKRGRAKQHSGKKTRAKTTESISKHSTRKTARKTKKTKKAEHAKKHAVHKKRAKEEVTAEEFFMPSPVHKGKYRIPLGIRFLIGYLMFIGALYIVSFVSSIAFPTTILFGQLVTGARAVIVNAFLLLLVLSVIYGLWKRKWYAFDLSIGFFMFSTLNSLLSITLFEWSNHPFKRLMLLSFISLVLVNVVIVWYILKERKYFYAKMFRDKTIQHTDKIFLYTVITFWIVALLIGATLGLQYYGETKAKIDSSLKDIRGEYFQRGEYICLNKQGEDRDVCFLVLATAQDDLNVPPIYTKQLCDRIDSDFYRFVCYRSIS